MKQTLRSASVLSPPPRCPAHTAGTAFTSQSPRQGHTCAESTPSIFMAGTHTRAALQGLVRSRAGHSTPDTAWEAGKSPPEPLCCLPIAPPRAHTVFHPPHTDRACAGTSDCGQHCVGSGCTRIISWLCVRMGFGHPLPTESLREVIPTLISLTQKRHEGQGHDWLKAGHPGHGRAMAAPTCPLSNQNTLKMRP